MARIAALAGLALVAAAPATEGDGAAKLARALAGQTPAGTRDCIAPREVRSTEVIPGTAIVYRAVDRTYINRPQAGAARLRWDDVLATRVDGDQLCRIDTVALLDPVTRMRRGFVVLAGFEVYRPAR